MLRFMMIALVSLTFLAEVDAGGGCRRRGCSNGGCSSGGCSMGSGYVSYGGCSQSGCTIGGAQPVGEVKTRIDSPASIPSSSGSDDALNEVNAARAARGLRPFINDPGLNAAALACAKQRCARHIDGHLPESDFRYLPSGTNAGAAGCGALDPSWGWGTCCTYDSYTYGGAAWVMGSDGKRYMHLFVR